MNAWSGIGEGAKAAKCLLMNCPIDGEAYGVKVMHPMLIKPAKCFIRPRDSHRLMMQFKFDSDRSP